MGVHQAIALISNTKQVMSEGKLGPVEARLTGVAATALLSSKMNLISSQVQYQCAVFKVLHTTSA